MELQLIRNATLRLRYGGISFLIDPYLGPRYSQPSWAGQSPNPTVDLPLPLPEVLTGVEVVLVSHLHPDHFDETAEAVLDKSLPVLCQPEEAGVLREKGFLRVHPLKVNWSSNGVAIKATPGRHGCDACLEMMGPVTGFLFRAPDEPTLYWAGDTIWCEEVRITIRRYRPEVIVAHAGGAIWGPDEPPVILDAAQTVALCRFAPRATVVATHLEAIELVTVSRAELRQVARLSGIGERQLRIPQDGETLIFGHAA